MEADGPFSFISTLMNSGEYSDLTLVCEGQEFRVHKAIVCPQSPVLAAALRGEFKEGATNTIDINFDAATLKRMISFMYTGDYQVEEQVTPIDVATKNDASEVPPVLDPLRKTKKKAKANRSDGVSSTPSIVVYHVRVNQIADYYNVSRLVQLANSKIEHVLRTTWSCESFIDGMREASAGERSLQTVFAGAAARHMDDLSCHKGFAQLDNLSPFTTQLLRIMTKQIQVLVRERIEIIERLVKVAGPLEEPNHPAHGIFFGGTNTG